MDTEMRLSIIIPTYNRHERVVRAVDALSAQIVAASLEHSVEVIVVDDGSGPDCAARTRASIIGRHQPFLRHIGLPRNRGAAAARNAGALASRGSILAFLDDDIRPADEYVQAIIQAHEQRPDILVINGNLRARERNIYADFWFYYYNAVFNRLGNAFYTVEMLAAGHVSMKREVLTRVRPLFDPSLTAREDFDLYLRLRAEGIPSHKDDRILAYNDCRNTLGDLVRQRLWYMRGQEQLIAKHGTAVVRMQPAVPPDMRFLHLYIVLLLARLAARAWAITRGSLAAFRGGDERGDDAP